MTATLKLCIKHTLSKSDLRKRIVLSWTLLRLHHVLLKARTEDDPATKNRHFVVDLPNTAAEAIQDVERNMTWLEDHGFDSSLNDAHLHYHALNVSRIIQPSKCLSKLHILPLQPLPDGTLELRFLLVIAHQISDGLSAYNWFKHFITILNTPSTTISSQISAAIHKDQIRTRLPSAQEDLYPTVPGSRARQRWFWAIMRVLRHVQKTMPPTFKNPLIRHQRLDKAIPLPPTYASIFDYDGPARPPMSSAHLTAALSPTASAHLIALCRASNISIGSGCFALAGLAMMTLHAQRYPSNTSTSHPGFGASFPLNPRAFFTPPPEADSCMLAFSEGIVMPFLPASIPVAQRFKLVARHANSELRVYQKRARQSGEVGMFDKHSPARLLATGYLAGIERVDRMLPAERRAGVNPQGGLRPRVGEYGATCGVSSVGSLKGYFRKGEYDFGEVGDGKRDFVANYQGLRMGVRARENEFLVGSSSDAEGIIGFGVSYDENAISREAAETWARTVEGLLEPEKATKL